MTMADENLIYWLALKSIPGIGNASVCSLVEKFGSAAAVFRASAEEISQASGISKKTALRISDYKAWDETKRAFENINKDNIRIITFLDKEYPHNLLAVDDRPAFLYARGELHEDDINLAIVGSRIASTYGKYTTERISRELAQKGITIVSGMARGVDSAAHRGALAVHGRTIAVLGSGLDIVYPPENQSLFNQIIENGAVVSEFPPGMPPLANNFPARNRIISGMSYGVVVVEAGEKSGSLITARLALEQGREVFAVPGSIDTASSRGTNKLIKEGAKLIENADDILEEIIPQLERRKQPSALPQTIITTNKHHQKTELTPQEKQIIVFISYEKVHADEIIAQSKLPPADVLSALFSLELKGLVAQHPGKYFSLNK